MSLKEWVTEKHLRRHKTSSKEITDLLDIVERDSGDAATEDDAEELLRFVAEFKDRVSGWLKENHNDLLLE